MRWVPDVLRTALVAVGAAALAACGMFGFGGGTKPQPLPAATAPDAMKLDWKSSVPKAGEHFRFQPAFYGGRVFAASADGTLTAFDEQSGATVWRKDLGAKLAAGAAAGENIVAVADTSGQVFAVDANGEKRFNAAVGAEVHSPARVIPGSLLVRGSDGRLAAFNLTDGKRRWLITRTVPSLTLRMASGIAWEQGAAFAGMPGGKLIAVDAESGRVGWETPVAQPKGATELERLADVIGSPVVENERVCAAAFQGRVACFEGRTGNVIWARDASAVAGLALDAKGVYVIDDLGNVLGFDKRTGASLWKQDKLATHGPKTIAATERGVVVGDNQGTVHLIGNEAGELQARVSVDSSPVLGLIASGKTVYAQSRAGTVAKLSTR